jgi:carbonic anhydrase/acetyltransferase-like protein (isoleucine patch superfamily)
MQRYPSAVIRSYRGKTPQIHPTAFIASGVQIIGDVIIGEHASIWYNCVLRADLAPIRVGARSNVQDGTVIHVEGPRHGRHGPQLPTDIGEGALIGHMAVLHGCTVEDGGFVGMGAIVMDGACVASHAMLAAGALLPPGKVVPSGELWTGRPARKARGLREAEIAGMKDQVEHYLEMAAEALPERPRQSKCT